MGRSKKCPGYNPDNVMKELTDLVCGLYEENGELKRTAEEIGLSPLKVRKILVSAGVYENDIAAEVNELFKAGMSPMEIQEITGLGRSSVNGYLPYIKTIYKQSEVSLNAQRIAVHRERKNAVKNLTVKPTESRLWEAVVAFQEYPFYTASGLPFSYLLKVGRNGKLNKELIVNRCQDSKTLAWSSIKLAFEKAMERKGEVIVRPKAIGDIRGISYIYPMLYRFGLIEVPEKTAEKMQLRGGKQYMKKDKSDEYKS